MCLSSGEGEFCEWLLKIGNKEISNLKVPEKCLVQSRDESITSVFDFKANNSKSNFLCTTNDCALKVNDEITKRSPSYQHSINT